MLACSGPTQPNPEPPRVPSPEKAPIGDPPPSQSGDVHDPVEPQPVDEADVTTEAIEQALLDEGEDIAPRGRSNIDHS